MKFFKRNMAIARRQNIRTMYSIELTTQFRCSKIPNPFHGVALSAKSLSLLKPMNSPQRQLIILMFAFLFFLTGCEPETVPISVEPAEPQIAVSSSLIAPSDTMFVVLSRSFDLSVRSSDISDEDDLDPFLLDRALVILEYEGFKDTLESFFDIKGLYGTQLQSFEDFQPMKLTVFDSTTSETATAETLLLPQVEMNSVQVTRKEDSSNLADFSYNISDPEGGNFYVVQVYELNDPDIAQSDSPLDDAFLFDSGSLLYEQLLTDHGAENGVIQKEDIISTPFASVTDYVLVVVTNISEGYYNFLDARQRSGSLTSSLGNEPVHYPTNVENGVGYFSAHRPKTVIITVEED